MDGFLRLTRRVVPPSTLILVSLALTLVALEGCLRIWDGVPVFSAINFIDREVNAVLNGANGLAQFDDRFGWTAVPNRQHGSGTEFYTVGEYGARMSGHLTVPLQQRAILVVGDSFATGAEVDDGETWPAVLERQIGMQVINAAVGGYGFDQIVLRAEDLVPRLRPRMLLVQTNLTFELSLNRMSVLAGAPKPYFIPQDGKLVLKNEPVPRGVSRSMDIGWQRSLFGHSYLVQYLMTRLNLLQWWVAPADIHNQFVLSDRQAVEVSCLLMRRLREIYDHFDIPVALVFQHGPLDGNKSIPYWEKDRAYVTRCAEQERLPVVDIYQTLHTVYEGEGLAAYQQLWVMHDAGRAYGHMSAKGNKLVANLVFQQLFSLDASETKPQSAGP